MNLVFVASVVEGLGGAFSCYLMAILSYLSDITTHEQRAMRIVILEAVQVKNS